LGTIFFQLSKKTSGKIFAFVTWGTLYTKKLEIPKNYQVF